MHTRWWPDGPGSRTVADTKQTGHWKQGAWGDAFIFAGNPDAMMLCFFFLLVSCRSGLASKNDSRLIAPPSVTSLVETTWRWPSPSRRLSEHGLQHPHCAFRISHLSQLYRPALPTTLAKLAAWPVFSSFHGVLDSRGARNAIFGDICYHTREKLRWP